MEEEANHSEGNEGRPPPKVGALVGAQGCIQGLSPEVSKEGAVTAAGATPGGKLREGSAGYIADAHCPGLVKGKHGYD